MVAHKVAATAAALMAAACVAAVVILAADGRPGTEEPLPATALAQEETARRLETAGLGGIFRRRSWSTAQRERPRQRTMAPAGLAVATAGLRSVGNPPCQPWRRHRPHRAALGRPQPWSAFGCHPRGVCPARRYRSYTATVSELQRLVKQRPDLAKLWSTQERYGLQSAGVCEGTPCMNWVLEVTEHARPTYGCSLPHLWLQPVPHMVAACPTYGCR